MVQKLQAAFAKVLTGDELKGQLEGNVAAMLKYTGPGDFQTLWANSEKLLAPHVENVRKSKK